MCKLNIRIILFSLVKSGTEKQTQIYSFKQTGHVTCDATNIITSCWQEYSVISDNTAVPGDEGASQVQPDWAPLKGFIPPTHSFFHIKTTWSSYSECDGYFRS